MKILFIFLMISKSFAYQSSSSYQNMVQRSQASEFISISTIKKWKDAYENKCAGRLSEGNCLINECDISLPSCRIDHFVFFRGENTTRKYPNTSSLIYSLLEKKSNLGGEDQSEKNIREILNREIEKIKPIDGVGDGESVILDLPSDSQKSFWSYFSIDLDEDDNPEYLIERPKNGTFYWQENFRGESMNNYEIYAGFHMSGNYIWYNDPKVGPLNISPVVSYSADPDWAYAFARDVPKGQEGRFFVLSVSKSKLINNCKGNFPRPGEIINTMNCPIVNGLFREEQEVQAVFYPGPEYIYKAYRVKFIPLEEQE